MTYRYFIEFPMDYFYNVGRWTHNQERPYPVIYGDVVEGLWGDPILEVVGPEVIKKNWPTLMTYRLLEVPPMSNLTEEQYRSIFTKDGKFTEEVQQEALAKVAQENAL